MQLLMGFRQSEDLPKLEIVLRLSKETVDLFPDGHMAKLSVYNNIGSLSLQRFDCLEELGDIEEAIGAFRNAANLAPDDGASKASCLNNLGNALRYRFEQLNELSDIEEAISALKLAVELTSDYAGKALRLGNLGGIWQSCFKHSYMINDIKSAIDAFQDAVNLTSDDNVHKASRLMNLGIALSLCFEHFSEVEAINRAIDAFQVATDITSDSHAEKSSRLNSLGSALQLRYRYLGNLSDLMRAISAFQRVINRTPDGHANKASYLNNLGIALRFRFQHLGQVNDIEKGLAILHQAVDLTSDSDVKKPIRLTNLGAALQSRFEHFRDPNDIKKAVDISQQALELIPDGISDKVLILHNLGSVLRTCFEHLGDLNDVDRAIGILHKAVVLTPIGNAYRPSFLNSLGTAFMSRYDHLLELNDIEKAVDALQQAVDLTPHKHAESALRLTNLGAVYARRYERLGNLADIEKAIGAGQKAIELTPDGHPAKPARLSNLGTAIGSRFECLHEQNDIEKAITILQQAVDLVPDDHADKHIYLSNLGVALNSQFQQFGGLDNIDRAIAILKQAVNLTSDHHVSKASKLSLLGTAFHSRFKQLADPFDLHFALLNYQAASFTLCGTPSAQLRAAIAWAHLCSTFSAAIPAYTRAFELIPQVIWLGKTIKHRYEELVTIQHAINGAIATAIAVGELPRAVEWFEEGRSIVWHQILQLQSPLDALYKEYPDKANELERLSKALENAGNSRNDGFENIGFEAVYRSPVQQAQYHHQMAIQYEGLIQEIRGCDGLENFLKPKKFSELASAATDGPVAIVNVYHSQCDALVLCPSSKIIHVPLPNFSYQQANQLYSKLVSSLEANHVRVNRESRLMQPAKNSSQDHFQYLLSDLWSCVVQPIVCSFKDVSLDVTKSHLPHITWCVTGPLIFLPLHAAGIYGFDDSEKNLNISDFMVSSYTTTLTAMLGSASKPEQQYPTRDPNVLIVSQPATPGLPPLPGTLEEANIIQKYTSPDYTCHLSHETATIENVIAEMGKYNVIHLACHAIQDLANPLNSAFALFNGQLALEQLMGSSLENAQIAVLSACQTATGDQRLPEESVHLAAGMLAVGYPNVIATMWSIGDNDAPLIADRFYASLSKFWDNSESFNTRLSPAYALHDAISHLREEVGELKFVKWVPFIHFRV
ncbi:hypothetical protein VKT23_004798 [Stygiomarasmius scandens]|uniref:CHAT domain-containing protein n=1 Tax=Marasmiellus scandens TaxID=2682957 RepID=A0ABR1JR96_9AGAR